MEELAEELVAEHARCKETDAELAEELFLNLYWSLSVGCTTGARLSAASWRADMGTSAGACQSATCQSPTFGIAAAPCRAGGT